jgi:hypothetical protein
MLKIPYEKNPGNACALACYTMTARYFFPESSFEQIAKISGWKPGFVIWPYKFWLWILDKGIKITDFDLIDAEAWANDGLEGLRKSISTREYEFYLANTKDIDSYSVDIKKVLAHPNFIYRRQKSEWEDLVHAVKSGGVCEAVLDARTLDKKEGFSLHRVVVPGVDNGYITFHDPRGEPCPARTEPIDLFRKAWLEVVDEPELCVYRR